MAIDFDGTGDYLQNTSTAIRTAYPFSMACWYNADNVTSRCTLMSIYDISGGFNQHSLNLSGTKASDPIEAESQNFLTVADAATTAGYTAGSWQHACGVWNTITDRRAFKDGGSKGTNATSVTDPGATLDSFTIGATGLATQPMFGLIAHAAVWNIALSDAEVALLAAGAHPMMVRPEALIAYWPMFDNHAGQVDWVGGVSLTVTGNPTIAASDPRIGLPPWQKTGNGALKASSARVLTAAGGSYLVTGTAASLEFGWLAAAGAGAYTITGTAASLERGLKVAAGAGSYDVTGSAAALELGRLVSAGAGSYVVTGTDATLTVAAGRVLAADAGSYVLSGQDANLEIGRLLTADNGIYLINGADADLTITAAPGTAALPILGAGSGKKRRNIPRIRLLDGAIYEAATWEEFTKLLAAIEYRTGEPPYQPVNRKTPVKIALTPEQLAETYRAYLKEFEPQLADQRLTEFELRIGLVETEIEEEESRRDRARRLLLLFS